MNLDPADLAQDLARRHREQIAAYELQWSLGARHTIDWSSPRWREQTAASVPYLRRRDARKRQRRREPRNPLDEVTETAR